MYKIKIVTTLALSLGAMALSAEQKLAEWLSVPSAPVASDRDRKMYRAADGTSWFHASVTNAKDVATASWTVSGLGVFEAYVNGKRVGDDFLKPGATHCSKTRYAFTYDVTGAMKTQAGAENALSAAVGAGWWRDQIYAYQGKKSAFWGVLSLTYADGTEETFVTRPETWRCGIAGPILHSGIYDGEEYDARRLSPWFGEGLNETPEINRAFTGELLPTDGAEVCLRFDLAMPRGPYDLKKGETLVVDFGQNCAAVPFFRFRAKTGTVLTVLPGEMLNDAPKGERGCDGEKGSVYRENMRIPQWGMRLVYTFAGRGEETYLPRFTYFGYRYLSLSATDDVRIESVTSVPVTSIRPEMESGKLETGDSVLNRFLANVRWGQLSNFLSVPTDCPQRNERMGWCADTQVFAETACYLADTRSFFGKWLRDLRDCQDAAGGFTSVAPTSCFGEETFNFGWADAGIIVPYRLWMMYDAVEMVRVHFDAMMRFMRTVDARQYDFEDHPQYRYADWLSYQKYETFGNAYGSWKSKWRKHPEAMSYRRFLATCYWKTDAEMLAEMATAIGRTEEVAWLRESAARAAKRLRENWIGADGLLLPYLRELQTACLFALRCGAVEGAARTATCQMFKDSIAAHDGCLQTGFLGTSVIMDTLSENGMTDLAYALLLNHKCPSWLYSVDQGATTVWERWNSYTKERGFGPANMNSFNHYAYGAVVAWIYKVAAGIAPDRRAPGFRVILLRPQPDRRLGYVKAEYRSAHGLITSHWRYEGRDWIWSFTIPAGTTATVCAPGWTEARSYAAGHYRITLRDLP